MADGSLARRYARALLEVARDEGRVDTIAQHLDGFVEVLDQGDGQLRRVLVNPGLTTLERRSVLDAVLDRLDLDAYVTNFLKILVDKSRFENLDDIILAYRQMADAAANRVRATVVTARPLGADMAKQVQEALAASTGKTVVLTQEVDPSVLGGMVVRIGDTVYDASIRARLANIEAALLRTPGQA